MKKKLSLLLLLFIICFLSVLCLTSCDTPAPETDPNVEESDGADQNTVEHPPAGAEEGSKETETAPTVPTITIDPIQTVYYQGGLVRGNTAEISADADVGYRFVGWTDGKREETRSDSIESIRSSSLEAIFEPICVDLFVNDLKIRSVRLSEFVTLNETDLFIPLRGKSFQSWAVKSSPVSLNTNESLLNQIKYAYESGRATNIENIALTAHFRESVTKEFYAFQTIAHALGGAPWLPSANTYLNSLEVFDYHYGMGQRFFEIDLLLTKDGKIVALHQYETELLYDEFMATRREGFTPIDLELLIDMMLQYPEIRMDLDILSVYRSGYEGTVAEKLTLFYDSLDAEIRERDSGDGAVYEDIYERLVLEIFFDSHLSSQMLEIAKDEKYGFKYFMYAGLGDQETPTGTSDHELEAILQWCVANDIKMMSTKIVDKDFIAMTDRYDIFTFAYTYNSLERIQQLLSIGVDCVFTDFVYL